MYEQTLKKRISNNTIKVKKYKTLIKHLHTTLQFRIYLIEIILEYCKQQSDNLRNEVRDTASRRGFASDRSRTADILRGSTLVNVSQP